jgi:hypothetical protein
MAGVVSRRRCVVGRDVYIVEESREGVCVESALRLRPGTVVDLVGDVRGAVAVVTWMVARLGKDGTVYRGRCRWLGPAG